MNNLGVCKFCGEEAKLIKAHIIPESFYFIDKTDPRPMKIISNVEGVHPKQSRTGIYDTEILCARCDQYLGKEFDQFSKQKLFNQNLFERIEKDGELISLVSDEIDKNKLLKFIISLAWRASITTRVEFRRINLGRYEELALRALKNDPDASKTFDAFVACFWNEEPATLDPHYTRYQGVKIVQFYAANYIFYLKVDRQPFGSHFREFSLRNSPKLIIFNRSYLNSKERRLMVKTAQKYPDLYR